MDTLSSLAKWTITISKENWIALYDLLGPEKILDAIYELGDGSWPMKISHHLGISEWVAETAYYLYHDYTFEEKLKEEIKWKE